MALLPYPSSFPQEALMMMLDKFRGNEVNTPDLINAAWNVVGYGLGQSMGGGKIFAGSLPQYDSGEVSDAEVIEMALKNNGVDVGESYQKSSVTFVPWFLLAQIALKLIAKVILKD